MKTLLNWFRKYPRKTLDELICSDSAITISQLLELDAIKCQSDIVSTAKKLLDNPQHSRSGYTILGTLAAGGDSTAQFLIGEYCEFILERLEQAAIWYKLAADQGSARAQKNYADMLSTGKGVILNQKEAFLRYNLAAEQGIAEAQFEVGEFYRNGTVIPRNFDNAVYWYERAKRNGIEQAEIRIMQIRGVIPDIDSGFNIKVTGKAVMKLQDVVLTNAGPDHHYYPGSHRIKSELGKAFPLVYIN
jgi:TPR repeat protein